MGGTRFIGVYLTQALVNQGHEVVLFNRGNRPAPVPGVGHIQGDRTDSSQLQTKLAGESFDVIFDNNGRELRDTHPLVEIFRGRIRQFIYVSSAGVYRKSDQMPHQENDPLDPKSRHSGKSETEAYLQEQNIPFTAIRPVYIYGPLNYNPLESWFFDRIVHDRPIPIPGEGLHLTQLGHVQDLANAMVATLENPQAIGQIYNISGDRFVTLNGLAKACAIAVGKTADQVQIVNYNPKQFAQQFDLGKRKAFPIRAQHFFASIEKAKQELNWQPQFDLVAGLKDAFQNDYLALGKDQAEVDFSVDEEILLALPNSL
jgi:UDP-glucose 4-epimerase